MADPQVNPNALGAPTEGFGQSVTFAFDPRGVTPSLELAHSQGPQIGVQGSPSRGQLADPHDMQTPKPDPTAALLMKAGAELLAPKIEEEKNRNFVKGIQRAMGGEAAQDIAKEQPWYSRIFGATPAVEGARAYETSAKVNKLVAEQTANMEQIKHLDADGAAKHFSDLINKQMTGDPATDNILAKTLIEQMPGLMKAQAKVHYAYGQKRASDALGANMETAFGALQQAGQLYAEDKISDEDMAARKKLTVASIMPPDGINEENYGKVLLAKLKHAADTGQFHAINAVRESGGFAALHPEQLNALESSITAAANRHKNNYAYDFSAQISTLKSDAAHMPEGMTPHDIANRIDTMNTAFSKLTGNPQGLFTSDEKADMLTGSFNYRKAQEKAAAERQATLANKQATAEQKAVAAAELQAQVDGLVAEGDVFLAGKITKASQDQIDTTAYKWFTKDPAKGTDMLRNNFIRGGYVNPIMKEKLQAALRGADNLVSPDNGFFGAVDNYAQLSAGPGGKALAQAYYGEWAPRLERFIRMTEGNPHSPNVNQAFSSAMDRSGTFKKDDLSDKESAALLKEVTKRTGSAIPRWLGGEGRFRDETLEVLAAEAKPSIADWRGVPGMTDEEAVGIGVQNALSSKRLEVLGGFVIRRGEQVTGPLLRDSAGDGPDGYTAIPKGKEDDYFRRFMESKGIDTSGRASIYSMGKANGADRYAVTFHKDGELANTVMFTSADWQRFAKEQTKVDFKDADKHWYQMGPALTNNPAGYSAATEEAWRRAKEERTLKLPK